MTKLGSGAGCAVVLLLACVACGGATTVGGYSCFPDPDEMSSAEYCLWVSIEGGRGKAYVERSEKRVHLAIRAGAEGDAVLERIYVVEAGDLHWSSSWPEVSNLEVIFYEYGDAAAMARGENSLSRVPRQVFALAFARVESNHTFVEAPAPGSIVEEAAEYDTAENRRHIVTISFPGDPEHERRILEVVTPLASVHELGTQGAPSGLIGRVAGWSKGEFSVEVQRHASIGTVAVTLQDYGDRDLSAIFAKELVALPDIRATRRFVSVNLRVGSPGLQPVEQAVGATAAAFGLAKVERQGMFTRAQYGAEALTVKVVYFEEDGRVNVPIEDTGWSTKFYEVEEALRAALLPPSSP